MVDFMLTKDGDLAISPSSDINVVKKDDLKLQSAHCRVQSVKSDWYIDRVGANLESLIGMPADQETLDLGESLITNSLTEYGLYRPEEIYIESTVSSVTSLTYRVYLRTEERRANLMNVVIDGIQGILIN